MDAKKAVKIFGWASFLNDLGSDMVYPIWPLFVTSFLGADMAVLGFLDGMGNAIVSLSQAASGYLSDRYGRKKAFIWSGYLLGSVSRVGYALSTTWHWLIPFKALDRTGKIRDAPRDAIVANLSARGNRGANFGYLRAMDNAGAVTGIVVSIIFFSWLGMGFRIVFLLAALPTLASAALVFFFIRERRSGKIRHGLRIGQLGKNYRKFLLLSTVFALGSFSYSFFIVYAKEAGMPMLSVPVFYLLFTVVASASSMPFGRLADQYGRKSVLAVSFLLFALACASTFVGSQAVLLLVFLFYGLHLGALAPVQKAFVAELSPKKYRASGLGAFQMVMGLAAFPASMVAGLLWVSYGHGAAFALSAVLAVLAAAMLIFVKERQHI